MVTTDRYVLGGDQIGIHRLFNPEIMTPDQYMEADDHSRRFGFVRLAAAILEQVIDEIRRYRTGFMIKTNWLISEKRNRRLYEDNIEWIRSEDRGWIFSFENCCDYIGLSVGATRAQLLDEGKIPTRVIAYPSGRHNMRLSQWMGRLKEK